MESDFKPMHDNDSTEPILEVVEGDAAEPKAESAIVPNAFETVLAQYDEHKAPKVVEPEAPAYKNRAFIAAICVVGGIIAGRLTTQPKVETHFVQKDRPVLIADQSSSKPEAATLKVNNAFRELTDLKEFDPWQPMNGGFPLPPKETQANVVSRSGGSANFNPAPPSLRGNISPMDPSDIGGALPNIGGKGIALPANPDPGGKTTTQTGSATVVGTTNDVNVGKERYAAITVTGTEPSQGQSLLAKLASSLGGSANTFTHMAEDGTVDAQGILLIIPAAKYELAKTKIESLGGATVDADVEGIATGEQTKIQGLFLARLSKLRDKHKDLLVDFLDDAQPVKQIKEAIDFEARAVSATRLPAGLTGKTVIRVLLK